VVTLVLVAAFTAVLVIGSQPAACMSCHAAYASTGTPHAKASCYGCHLENGAWSWPAHKVEELTVMYPAAWSGARAIVDPPKETSRHACLGCHDNVLKEVVTAKGLRIDHVACAAKASSCDVCHALQPHATRVRWKREVVMEDCIACHRAQKISIKCDLCHVSKGQQARLARGPWQVTHGPNWEKTHGMGTLASCVACHPADYCVRCHGTVIPHGVDFGTTHGKQAEVDRDQCLVCHKSEQFCKACHGIDMPHPAGFLKTHDKAAKGAEDQSCIRCHISTDCIQCHNNHIHIGGTRPLPFYKVPHYDSQNAPQSTSTTSTPNGAPIPFQEGP
jgi:hypothetical protein